MDSHSLAAWAYDLLACGGFCITIYILLLIAAGL
jgi:hypothetical protein